MSKSLECLSFYDPLVVLFANHSYFVVKKIAQTFSFSTIAGFIMHQIEHETAHSKEREKTNLMSSILFKSLDWLSFYNPLKLRCFKTVQVLLFLK